MALLAGAYGRVVDGPVTKMYYNVLSDALEDFEWQDVVHQVVAGETFWPSPATILKYAHGDPSERSLRAWDRVVASLKTHGGFRFHPAAIAQSWSPETWAGIKAVGGLAEISTCSDERWASMLKRFRTAYESSLTPQPLLEAPDEPDERVKQLVADVGRGMALPRGDR